MVNQYTEYIKKMDLRIKSYVNNLLLWKYKTKLLWNWIEFANIREYQYGDSYKSIDWTTTAKKGEKHIKEYTEERNINITLLIDNTIYTKDNNVKKSKLLLFEEIILFLWLLSSKDSNEFWAIIPDWEHIRIIKNTKSKNNILNIINSFKTFKTNELWLKNWLKTILNLWYKKWIIFLVTDRTNLSEWETLKKELFFLSKNNEVIIVNWLYDFEENFDNYWIKIKNLLDPLLLFSKSQKWNINKNIVENKQKLYDFFKSLKINYLQINNNEDIVKKFYSFLLKKNEYLNR